MNVYGLVSTLVEQALHATTPLVVTDATVSMVTQKVMTSLMMENLSAKVTNSYFQHFHLPNLIQKYDQNQMS